MSMKSKAHISIDKQFVTRASLFKSRLGSSTGSLFAGSLENDGLSPEQVAGHASTRDRSG